MKITRKLLISLALIAISSAPQAKGQDHQSQSIEEVVVTADIDNSLSAHSASEAIHNLQRVPGGVDLVRAEDYLVEFTQSIGDALKFTPGVYADTSAQRDNRISIRGSAANATYERRGITVLRDGVPISRASGSTEYQEIDPLSIDYIEIYKGSNGLRYGAASLGGAINVVTPTGATSKAGSNIRLESGSFDTYRTSINTKGRNDAFDYYGAVTKLNSSGFREHSEVDSIYSFGNVGYKFSDNMETRFFLTALQDNFELAGSLTHDQALSNPDMSPESNIERDMDRNLDVFRLSNRTVFALDSLTIEAGAWLATRYLDHAITPYAGIIEQGGMEFGISTDITGNFQLDITDISWVIGITHAESNNESELFAYSEGPFSPTPTAEKGNLSSKDDRNATNTVIYGQLDFPLSESLNLIAGAQYISSVRENKNIFNSDPAQDTGGPKDDTGKLSFEKFNGRLGVIYTLQDENQLYANVSEGYEPPGITDLTSGGADPFTILDAQESLTFEVGSRGQKGIVSWDASIYHSEISNEFVDVGQSGFSGETTSTENARGNTLHKGVELGFDIRINKNILWRNIYNYNDFSFDNDPDRGDNKLPGIPQSIYASELKYSSNDRWYAGINLRHIANGAYVDFANTERTAGYELIGIIAGISINEAIDLFASAENLTDEKYISNVSTVSDLSMASSNSVFTPGQGRAFYVGISTNF
ncbi:TonB-dependent receptor family protein [Microbulbifer sp. ZKSA004]|uniref:TonB-dependent receptor family protein n=1 Tax=Microbulbifer sp. ZKSA004 TaxID=3243389 RepID=UPI00403A3521